jgi:hypothetical protein
VRVPVDVRAEVTLPCTRERAHAELADLARYPAWLGIVLAASPAAPDAWLVDLGARVGPLRRSKRVRMSRVLDQPGHLRFERRELDGVAHSSWDLDVTMAPVPGERAATFAVVSLHYGGTAWLPLLDVVLAAEVRRAGPRLAAIVAA